MERSWDFEKTFASLEAGQYFLHKGEAYYKISHEHCRRESDEKRARLKPESLVLPIKS